MNMILTILISCIILSRRNRRRSSWCPYRHTTDSRVLPGDAFFCCFGRKKSLICAPDALKLLARGIQLQRNQCISPEGGIPQQWNACRPHVQRGWWSLWVHHGEPESPSAVRHFRFPGWEQHAWNRQMAQEEETWNRHGVKVASGFCTYPLYML